MTVVFFFAIDNHSGSILRNYCSHRRNYYLKAALLYLSSAVGMYENPISFWLLNRVTFLYSDISSVVLSMTIALL